jgi:16S rRNA (uracil1498-N3)-methyltransferase
MSTAPLFFVDALPDGDSLALVGDEGRHAARVKRIGVGESICVGDGHGTVLDCAVVGVLSDGLDLKVMSRRVFVRAEPRLVVVQALPKGERADLAVEVLTELGVDEIVPWSAGRSIAVWSGARGERALAKWRRTAREAAKQSRRAWVPDVAPLAGAVQVAARLAGGTGLVLHEGAATSLIASPLPADGEVVLVVGPEGGISPDELALFESAGASVVRMGEPVLRTSTAGAAALAALSVRLGRWA